MALISYPDNTLTAALSGGSWQPTAPLANLSDPLLSNVARSANALAASSIIKAALVGSPTIQVISLCNHNITKAGTIRVRGYSDAGFTVLLADTGILPVWPTGFTDKNVADYPHNWTFCFAAAGTAVFWQVEISDTTNPVGYIELGRMWLGGATFSPASGVTFGMSNGYESRDVIEEAVGGLPWGEKRTPRRRLAASLNYLTTTEKRQALIMQKVLTETDEAFWVTDVDAVADDMLLEAFPCFLSKPSAIIYPYFNNHELPIAIIERV